MTENQLLLKIYEAASMTRWNDQIRAIDISELDKQAHKMIVAYVLGKCEQDTGTRGINWIKIIEAGLFEFLQRIVLTDIKPPLFHAIKEDSEKYRKLNKWVYSKNYLTGDTEDINRKIIGAAHFYVTKWEFNIIKRSNPEGYMVDEINEGISRQQARYSDLASMKQLLESKNLTDFVNICGQLRFQIRWSHLYRVPKTSVLGHMLIVAIFSYLFSYIAEVGSVRCINNYFTGLFHDLPEVLTRDIINPVKKSIEGLDELIKDYERQEMEKRIYKLIPDKWHTEIRMFTENEFSNTGVRDGELVKAADDLAAYIEAYLSLKNGIKNKDLSSAKIKIKEKYRGKNILGIDFGKIYLNFD